MQSESVVTPLESALVEHLNERHSVAWRVGGKFQIGRDGAWGLESPDGAKAVLKFSPLIDQHLQVQALVDHARGRGYPTPAVLYAGSLDGVGYHVMEYVEGERLRPGKLRGESLTILLALIDLARNGAPPAGVDWAGRMRGVVFDDAFELRSRVDARTAESIDEIYRAVATYEGAPVPSDDLVHGDFGPHNVAITADGPMVLDMAAAGSGSCGTDLADMIAGTVAEERVRVLDRLTAICTPEVVAVSLAYQALHWLWRTIEFGGTPTWEITHAHETARLLATLA